MMQNLVFHKLKKAFQLTYDLAIVLDEEKLKAKIPQIKSNKIGEQFWCIIGARESYLQAIEHSKWQGFSCTVKDCFSIKEVHEKLVQTTNTLNSISKDLNETQVEILFNLYTHEIQHHGQLIRYCYALGIEFPKSWNEKYTV